MQENEDFLHFLDRQDVSFQKKQGQHPLLVCIWYNKKNTKMFVSVLYFILL